MKRDKLREVIGEACSQAKIEGDERTRLENTVNVVDKILVGDFKKTIDGIACGCPATIAGFYIPGTMEETEAWTVDERSPVRNFPERFDRLMDERYASEQVDETYIPVED